MFCGKNTNRAHHAEVHQWGINQHVFTYLLHLKEQFDIFLNTFICFDVHALVSDQNNF